MTCYVGEPKSAKSFKLWHYKGSLRITAALGNRITKTGGTVRLLVGITDDH